MSPKAVPASRHMAPRILAQARFEALPPRFQCSVVGIAYRHIIEQLADDGMAPLQPVLEHMFPGMDARQARRELSTRYINRPFKDAAGQVPLKLQMSRPSRKAGNSSQLWFEAEAALNPADLTPVNPRYSAAGFEDMRATQATSTQMAAALEAARRAPSGSDDAQTPAPATRDVLALALAESALHDPVAHKAFKGLRQDVGEDFEGGGQARRSAGMTPMDDDKLAPAKKSARKAGPQGDAADTVNCLDAMLQWAKPQPPSPHRLLCLLGDYGTGKTSHCYQFCRVLNREAGHALWPGGSGNTMPAALYVDLAELAGVSTLADLSLAQLLTTVLNKTYTGDTSTLAAEVQQQLTLARVGQLVLVFDGLDELLKNDRAVLHKVFDQLLRVLEPSPQQKARGQGSLARVIVSCRTHYFRAVEDQHGFFNTRQRGVASSGDYLCLSLLPWEPRNIESYLGKRLPPDQAQELLHIIRTTYNLQELASRPVLLAMMGEQLGSLLRLRQAGEPITAARLYDITVGEWVQRGW